MNLTALSAIANHLWQSTLFAAVAGLLTLALRNNRARVRHYVWLAASCKFLLPLSILISLGGGFHSRAAGGVTGSNLSVVMDEVSQPFTAIPVSSAVFAAPPEATSPLAAILLGLWACGFLGVAGAWWIRWLRIRAVVRAGAPLPLGLAIPAISSPTLAEPGVFGILRPVLLLPEGIFERLTPGQSEAVIAHELCHVRYRDNLIAAIHMFVETVFWFYPLVWWIGKQMIAERERACDEEVLFVGRPIGAVAVGKLSAAGVAAASCCARWPLQCLNWELCPVHRAVRFSNWQLPAPF
jgi:bla regulator protein BlaR1